MTIPEFEEIVEQNDQTEARREHLERLGELVGNVYPNKFARSSISGSEDTISRLIAFEPVVAAGAKMAAIKASLKEGERPPAEAKDELNERLRSLGTVRIAGRLTTPSRGNFVHLTDGIGKFQIYCDKKGGFGLVRNDGADTLDPENGWTAWKLIDHGDFVGVEGYLFVTNTGEVSLHVEKLQFLAKAMVPMPDKMHGIADPEIRQRQRYADLIASSLQVKSEPPASAGGPDLTTREVFEIRAKVISSLRRCLEDHGYIEVETPMLTPKATGAAAKPFVTHHNALDITLYARIAPELYLKRLVVGGFEKVYELNRNFRNEGISYKHNPEFTMLEFYCAYMDVNGMMDFCEQMMQEAIQKATGALKISYEGNEINFTEFRRSSMKEAVIENYPDRWNFFHSDFAAFLDDPLQANKVNLYTYRVYIKELESGFDPTSLNTAEAKENYERFAETIWESVDELVKIPTQSPGSALAEIFEMVAESVLVQPTFIIDYPKSISPLSKASPQNPQIAERFELFINGMEVANGFSELNDPKEQYDRFVDQMSERERGDEEAMVLDEDYVRALSYGMPPAAGIGIGIDRLVMLLTNKHSIRDVILFPHLRPERKAAEEEPSS